MGHDVERPLGTLADDAGDGLELLHHRIPAALILLPHGGKILRAHVVQGGGGHLVQGGHRQAALGILHGVGHQLPVAGDEAADAGAAGREPLGYGVDDDDVFRRVRELAQGLQRLPGVDELPVRLVADDDQVVGLGYVHQHPHFLRRQHHAGGVAGVGAYDGPGMLVDLRLHPGPVGVAVALVGTGGNGVDRRAAGADHGVVVGIEGLGNQNLVAVVQDAVEGDLQRLGAAVGNEDIPGVEVHVQLVVIFLNGLHQHRHTGGGGIFQHRQVKMPHGLKIRLGRLDVRLADVQVIDSPTLGLGRHSVGVELPHRGQAAFLDLAGKFHIW